MQIKRFEAADMTEALRMVKREMGDDAVILSAKEIRSGGFFSALRNKRVEITAAADYALNDARRENAFSGTLSQALDAGAQTDRVSLSTLPLPNTVVGDTQQLPRNRIVADDQGPHGLKGGIALSQRRVFERVKPAIAEPIRRGTDDAPIADPAGLNGSVRHPDPETLLADPFYEDAKARTIIALVGPPGVGKSTTLAKLARYCRMVENRRIGLISLDRFRIDANGMLKKAARIMNLPLKTVHDGEGLQSALEDLADAEVVLIDTPGMGNRDQAMLDDVCRLLRLADPDEIHLVLNATARTDVLAAAVTFFLPAGVNRLLFAHMDAYGRNSTVLNLLKETGLPSSFYADGIDLFDNLQKTSVHFLSDYCCAGDMPQPSTASRAEAFSSQPENDRGQKGVANPCLLAQIYGRPVAGTLPFAGARVQAFPGKDDARNTGPFFNPYQHGSMKYVANRNSELFHHPTCKSVKRINVENIAAFTSIEQAINEGFKPCRACCNIAMVRESVTGTLGYLRASAK